LETLGLALGPELRPDFLLDSVLARKAGLAYKAERPSRADKDYEVDTLRLAQLARGCVQLQQDHLISPVQPVDLAAKTDHHRVTHVLSTINYREC
jgi:hypothetical protein